ncbi:ABC transporter ATP-binding protein [Afifella marina]|uniref:Putative spermidine/putrescine transport system ATP-binding protein n=1 Tax=Afifella marina DSM 2698 TaxID=1120955 RepID=A0A1G5MEQ9_AFIMA|nr:ABC transporter ATP-binding protein [Afifella marina]SCZ23161.1 putative spermidine/putrescine transport system ATP-binding protein [Afifella marina DSM 2698]
MKMADGSSNSDSLKLEVRNLRKTFGEFVALEGASVEVRAGEFLTLLGPSGSGKTTLLLAIAGLNEPDSGEIRIHGDLATYLPPYQRDIGMVFQNYALFPHMTIGENIGFPLRMRRWSASKIDEAVSRILDVVQLPGTENRYPRQLSGGQQQRIALARALVYEPSIVLMDEPLGALDKKLREQLQYEIKRLHERLGLAMLYVTHDQEEALVMSDRICLMRQGRIEQIGTPEELYFRPKTRFAADFLGESNLLEGEVIGFQDGICEVALNDGRPVRGPTTTKLNVGDKAVVMIRPEAIRINAAEAGANSVTATFIEAVMTGGTTKCFFEGHQGQQLKAQILTGQPRDGLAPNKEAVLSWEPDSCVVLAHD